MPFRLPTVQTSRHLKSILAWRGVRAAIAVCLGLAAPFAPAQSTDGFDVQASETEAVVGSPVEITIKRPPGGGVCAVEINYDDGNTKKRRLESKDESVTENYTFGKPGNYKITVSGVTQFKGFNIAGPCPGADRSVALLIRDGSVSASDRRVATMPASGAEAPHPSRNLAVVAKERRVALVIGNSAYTQGALVNPVNDARAMAKRLRSLGFDVVLRENLKTREIGGVYREFRSKIAPGDVALIFYAGHGVQFKGQNYFPAIDADIHSEEDVPLQSLNLGNLLDNMEEAKAGVSLVLLDACRDNPFARRFRSSTRGLAKVEAASGMLIHYATRPGSVASDGDGQNGTYTEALLTQMSEPGVPVELMLKRVANQVVAKTKGKQEPWVEGSLRGDFYFIFQGPTTLQLQAQPADPEAETWEAAENAKTAEGYQTYLDAYPQGRYAAAARIKLRGLQKQVAPVAVQPTPTPAPVTASSDNPETEMWNEVKASGVREYLDAYLKQYPKGKYAALAKVEIKKLDERDKAQRAKDAKEKQQVAERERLEALRNEQVAWDTAKVGNSVATYASYLERYPKGRYAALAQTALPKLQREAAEREKQEEALLKQQQAEAAKREEADLWRKAETATDSTTVQGYLDRYPTGRHVAEARVKLAAVKKGEAEMRPGQTFKDCADCSEMVVIPAGSFEMGGNINDGEKPIHRVTLKSFAIGKTEVTQGQWRMVVGNSPSKFSSCGDACPVEQVSWDNAKEFIRNLSAKTGKTYRLPSEAEWEYACRAGGKHEYCGGDNIDNVSWSNTNSDQKTHKAASKQSNVWGLYDMSGNVGEWVEDCWNASYAGAPADGSAWTTGDCTKHVVRGGSYTNPPNLARATNRSHFPSKGRIFAYGFRVVRTLEQDLATKPSPMKSEKAAGGLEWAESDNGADINWAEAKNYCGGKGSGWRLPTSDELQINYRSGYSTPCGSYSCKVASKSHLTGPWFWSNQQVGSSQSYLVHLYFGTRSLSPVEFRDDARALCVRGL